MRAVLTAALMTVSMLNPRLCAAQEQPQSDPVLTLDEVLRSSAQYGPQIVEALARIRQAQGRALSAEGAFDTVFDVDARSRALGYYDGTLVEGRATQPLTDNGGYVYGGYRVSRGTFPIYEDQSYTNRLGEVKVGGLYALMRGRLIDERRARRTLAAGDLDIARFEARATAIGVQRQAMDAYQNWLAAGLRLRAYRDLLDLAQRRRGGLNRQVQLGARAEILVTENEQNLVRRRALVVRAEQDVQTAANRLSFFLRNENGEPIVPRLEQLPADSSALLRVTSRLQDAALLIRPDIRTAGAKIEQALTKLALAENDLRPRLDLRVEASKDLGDDGYGGTSRTPLEGIVGVRLTVPLQNRAAKGKVVEAQAELDAVEARRRTIRDQIQIEINGILIALDGGARLVETAREELALAERLAAAERRRFELGSSDFFLVNQREDTATDARVRLIEAEARQAGARAELIAATADTDALQLDF
ncbi:TolC family protein [Novosphingobium sp. RD2P27]|uniref:TolC family protein n=1 Tax=Novosphingobium kalidii TaxID=3230299 RepID=A0ABV2D362_9SPHN